MGQFLAVGIATKLQLHPIPSDPIEFNNLQKNLENRGIDLSIYNGQQYGETWDSHLKPSIVEAELLEFLQSIYNKLQPFTRLDDSKEVINNFKSYPPESWIERLSKASFYNLQNDAYAQGRYYSIDGKRVQLRFVSTALVMGGKIFMETDNGLFDLFAAGLQAQLDSFQLSKAIRVYITG